MNPLPENKLQDAIDGAVRDFTSRILHGNAEHRKWLIDAMNAYLKGQPIQNNPEMMRLEISLTVPVELEGKAKDIMDLAYEVIDEAIYGQLNLDEKRAITLKGDY